MPSAETAKPAADDAVAAYVAGWRQDDSGSWWRPGTERDCVTFHRHPDDDSDFGIVFASSPTQALAIDSGEA